MKFVTALASSFCFFNLIMSVIKSASITEFSDAWLWVLAGVANGALAILLAAQVVNDEVTP